MSVFNFDSIKSALNLGSKGPSELDSLDLDGICKVIKTGKAKNIITMVGAGISTAAGIPDFRSPSTGIYDNLEEFNLPDPMAVFDIDYFRRDPRPFFEVSRRLYKPDALPTLTHYFIRLLYEKNLLLRHYTQNVDNLERLSGLPEDKLIEAHGTYHTGHCQKCHMSYDFEFMKDRILDKQVPKCNKCQGIVKPDVVFFGEDLPKRFYKHLSDFSACDLLIIIGTSLTVMPFCGLIHRVGLNVPRLYINREYSSGNTGSSDMRCSEPDNKRDVFVASDADEGVLRFAELLGWKEDLLELKNTNDALLQSGPSSLGKQKSSPDDEPDKSFTVKKDPQ